MSVPSETFLERIIAATREELEARQARTPLAEMQARAAEAPAPRPVRGGAASAARRAPRG